MDLAAVGRDGAARFGAAAVAGDQHDPLRRGGHPAGAEQVQRRSGGPVEHRQVVVGMRGQPDHVGDRHHGAAAGDADPGAAFQVLQGGADDDRHREPVELAEVRRSSSAMRPTAIMASCWRWARLRWSLSIWACVGVPEMQGSGSSGLHMPGAAYLAKIASHVARASGVRSPETAVIASWRCLPSEMPRRRARSVSSGSGPSWSSRNSVRSALSLSSLGSDPDGGANPVDLDLGTGRGVDEARQLVHRLADDLDVLAVDQPVGLGGRGRGKHRR